MVIIAIGEVIRYYRKKGGKTQQNVADYVHCSRSHICKLEQNMVVLQDDMIVEIKKFLGIEDTPVTDSELINLKIKLNEWNSKIRNLLYDEAERDEKVLRKVVERIYEVDINILFNLFYIRLLLVQNKTNEARLLIDECKKNIESFSEEHKFYYFYFLGLYNEKTENNKEALKFMLKAENLCFDNTNYVLLYDLYYAIAYYYTGTVNITNAIIYANRANEYSKFMGDPIYNVEINILLAINYNRIGSYNKAETIFSDCLTYAKRTQNIYLTSILNLNLGLTYMHMGFLGKASFYFDLEDTSSYIYYRANLLIKKGTEEDIVMALQLIKIGLEKAKSENKNKIILLLEALRCSCYMDDLESVYMLENEVIPNIINYWMYIDAIEYCKLLVEYYKDKRKYQKALFYSELINECNYYIIKGVD